MVGKLFGAILLVAPVAAISIWAYLHQTDQVETRMDADRSQIELKESRFDRDWEEAWNMRGSNTKRIEAAQARVEAAERKVAEMDAAKAAARKPMQEGAKEVDAALAAWEKAESQK